MRNVTFEPNNPPTWGEHNTDQDPKDIEMCVIIMLGIFAFLSVCFTVMYKLSPIRDSIPPQGWSHYPDEADMDDEDEDSESNEIVADFWVRRRVRFLSPVLEIGHDLLIFNLAST
jgi:hypothetical protein